MKNKEQILAWLDKQPWKDEFYKAIFLYENPKRVYNVNFLISAFHWGETIQGETIWSKRNKEYQKWYNSTSTDKPHSWEEYCEQNPITKGDCCIEDGEVCEMWNPLLTPQERDPKTCVDVMSEKLCDAFIAYMKLIQLRNAWVNSNFDPLCHKIVVIEDTIVFELCYANTNGLSFPTNKMAKEFAETFKDLLETAKPLL
jgi:hypothetical protein